MDQIFDRLGTLLRSFLSDDEPFSGRPSGARPSGERPFSDPASSGDPFLDEAMEELDAFLNDDREREERLRREREERAEREYRGGDDRSSGAPGYGGRERAKLHAAYKVLGLAPGAGFEEVRASYKRLLKQHHPDRHGSDPEAQRRATEVCARINDAYRIIETWHETGSLGDE